MKEQPIIDVDLPAGEPLSNEEHIALQSFAKRKTGNLLDYYWFNSEFTADQCSDIISLCKKFPQEEGTTFSKDPLLRKSTIRWIPPATDSLWIFDALKRLCLEANEVWNLDLDGFLESMRGKALITITIWISVGKKWAER